MTLVPFLWSVGDKARFVYPDYGTPVGFPDHVAHSGQTVTVIRPLTKTEADIEEVGPMYVIRANDGWEGEVFEDELSVLDK